MELLGKMVRVSHKSTHEHIAYLYKSWAGSYILIDYNGNAEHYLMSEAVFTEVSKGEVCVDFLKETGKHITEAELGQSIIDGLFEKILCVCKENAERF